MVEENFTARTARAGVGHHPEIVRLVLGAFVVANAHHALGWQADFFGPDVVGLVVVNVDRGPELVGRQFVDFGQQLPGPLQRLAFEVVAKAPVAQHLEKSVVTRGVADVFQVVVFAAGTQASLHRRSTHIGTFVSTKEHVFELHHA